MLSSSSASRFFAIATLVSLVACSLPRTSPILPSADSAASNDGRSGVSGVIKTTNWIVKKGQTVNVSGTLAVFATGNIEIDGKLIVAPGASIGLMAKGNLAITGSIGYSAQQHALDAAAANGTPPETNLDATNIVLDGFDHEIEGAAIASTATGTVTIKGEYTAANGADATKLAPPDKPGGAQSGSDMSVGSDTALQQVTDWIKSYDPEFGLHPAKPKKVIVTGTIEAGLGGTGYYDVNGVAQGSEQVLTGGGGATGGNLTIVAGEIEIRKGANVYAGPGGDGGSVGFDRAGKQKFSVKMDPARSLVAHLGDGGDAGKLVFVGVLIGQPNTSSGGPAGRLLYARAGNGGPAQNGGMTTVYTGIPGKGNQAETKHGFDGDLSSVQLSGGGNGGNSPSVSKPGGNGGAVNILLAKGTSTLDASHSAIANYTDGGLGFNGCPTLNGTNGGEGGHLSVLAVKNFSTIAGSFNGANGGDGTSPGAGGNYGTDSNGNPLGVAGNPGKKCSPFTTYTSPVYLYGQRITSPSTPLAIHSRVKSHVASTNLWFTGQGSSPPAGIGEITTNGAFTMFTSGFASTDYPNAIAGGPDGNLWFTDYASFGTGPSAIGRMTTGGTISRFSSGLTENPQDITAGPDGNLWFAESAGYPATGKIGQITTSGTIMEFSTGLTTHAEILGITSGPDNNLWFTDSYNRKVGYITTSGAITLAPGTTTGNPQYITRGPDGNLWFTESGSPVIIGKVTTGGTITEYSTGISGSATSISGITAGPLNSLWFLECGSLKLGQITTTGTVTETAIPNITTNGIPLGGITQGPDGNIWFVETNNQAIVEYNPSNAAFRHMGRPIR